MSSTHRSPTPPSTKRLLHELQQYRQEPNEALLHLGPVSEAEILHWEAVLKGVRGSPYEGIYIFDPLPRHQARSISNDLVDVDLGGLWKLDIRVPENYPLAPPQIKFVTPICHPNVHFKVKSSAPLLPDLLSWGRTWTNYRRRERSAWTC